jgi:hypothetical protein
VEDSGAGGCDGGIGGLARFDGRAWSSSSAARSGGGGGGRGRGGGVAAGSLVAVHVTSTRLTMVMAYAELFFVQLRIAGSWRLRLGEADLLRRAMGKKKKEEMDVQARHFIKGASEKGVPEAQSGGIFDLVAKFAGYGFNKSHAAAISLISFQTGWLKANHPVEFMAASQSAFDLSPTPTSWRCSTRTPGGSG